MFISKFLFLFFSCFLVSCNNNNSKQWDETKNEEIQTVKVTFFNESSYHIIVHRDSFYGPIIAEVNTTNREAFAFVRPSDNNGNGTVFSIEYIWIIQIPDGLNNETREVSVSGIDPNMQINTVIEINKPSTIQIPNPQNLEIKSAFINIINTHNLPIEFSYVQSRIRQADNNIIPIAPNRQGIYKLNGIPDEGEKCQYYNIISTFESTFFSDFVSQNGIYITKKEYIYDYIFNGTSIVKAGEQRIIFNSK
jgi:hypothetical protein